MTRAYFHEFLPLLMKRYAQVIAREEKPLTTVPRRAQRAAVIERFLETRDYGLTAREFGVTRTTINQIVYRAIRTAKELERRGKPPRALSRIR